jgi:hypothetical protein
MCGSASNPARNNSKSDEIRGLYGIFNVTFVEDVHACINNPNVPWRM